MMAEELAQEVDFFSLGTNDLTQYTLAIDRQNPKLDAFDDPHHPAVLRMIRQTVEAGHRHGCWVGIFLTCTGSEPEEMKRLVTGKIIWIGQKKLSAGQPEHKKCRIFHGCRRFSI